MKLAVFLEAKPMIKNCLASKKLTVFYASAKN